MYGLLTAQFNYDDHCGPPLGPPHERFELDLLNNLSIARLDFSQASVVPRYKAGNLDSNNGARECAHDGGLLANIPAPGASQLFRVWVVRKAVGY